MEVVEHRGTTGVIVGKQMFRILGKPPRPLRDGAVGQALSLQNRVHLALDARNLSQAERMNLVGGHVGGGV